MPSILGTGPGVHYKSLKTVNQSLKHKVNMQVRFELASERMQAVTVSFTNCCW